MFWAKCATVKGMRVPVFTANKIDSIPLKEMDPLMLFQALASKVQTIPEVSSDTVDAAVEFATFVHRHDKRENRAGFPKTAYIEHPLRNAIRAVRLGCVNQNVIIGCLLHDTVEDHATDIVKDFVGDESEGETIDREKAFIFIGQKFGSGVEAVVRGMSNPLLPEGITAEEKNVLYVAHVKTATQDGEVLITKILDYIDNALSLHHTAAGMTSQRLARLARKYLPLHDIFIEHLATAANIPLSSQGKESVVQKLIDGRQQLIDFANAA